VGIETMSKSFGKTTSSPITGRDIVVLSVAKKVS